MRILTTEQMKKRKKQDSVFSFPGFRSDSFPKKIIACLYYCFVFTLLAGAIGNWFRLEFVDSSDKIMYWIFCAVALGVFIAPIVIVGVSAHYDWHGIKLFLIVMVSVIVFIELAKVFFNQIDFVQPEKTASFINSGFSVK